MLRLQIFSVLLIASLTQLGVKGDAYLELKMIVYNNAASRDWSGSCCDPFCTACDHRFLFTIDNKDGRTDGLAGSKVGSIYQKQSGYFQDQNKNTFTSDISGVSNPIIQRFDTWPGKVLFKVYVQDDDSTSNDDDIDAFIQPLELLPQGSQVTSTWTGLVMYGLRNRDRSSLEIQHRLYCGANYYGKQCSVYCVAQDTNSTGHYTCDPNTGEYICLSGWKDPNKKCLTKVNECENNDCRNGATCVSEIGSYKCICRVGFSGNKCEIPTNVQCKDGFVGTSCDVNICDFLICKNGGTCRAGICSCATGYTGDYCEMEQRQTCADRPCQHDGTCYDASYTCSCLPDYTGARCESVMPPLTSNATAERSQGEKEFVISEIFGSKAGGLLIALIVLSAVLLLLLLLLVFCLCRLRRRVKNAEKDCRMLATGASTTITKNSDRKVSHNTYQSRFTSQSSVFSDVSEADSSGTGRNTSVSELIPTHYADCRPDPHYDTLDRGVYVMDAEKKKAQESAAIGDKAPPVPNRPKGQVVKDVRGETMKVDRKSSC